MADMHIRVLPNGPFEVTGGVPLDEKIIRPDGHGYRWENGRELEQREEYHLCRCGHSKNAPFCDGTHRQIGFVGRETAAKEPYVERAGYFQGPEIDLADDDRCAFARFCHSADLNGEASEAWSLAMTASSDAEIELAERVAGHCPAGRLTPKPHEKDFVEPDLEPGITVIQDPQKGVSAGLYVHGGIPLEGADREEYELRNRYVLCRCGSSRNKPFCDAFHVPMRYNDGFLPNDQPTGHVGTVPRQNAEAASPRSAEGDTY
ncbi:MAG: CDGSH iron-sulfur domain-containing protein [Arcanobacterium sp.]|nr:CDGSH iron-sulfur domain-containing protein [Arcanobacterium sp.]